MSNVTLYPGNGEHALASFSRDPKNPSTMVIMSQCELAVYDQMMTVVRGEVISVYLTDEGLCVVGFPEAVLQ